MQRKTSGVMRPSPRVVLAFLHLHIHIHHFRGPAIDYAGLGAASFASWIGVPGPGESLLIATSVLAARHHLGIVSVVFVAFAGANLGGMGGWLIGRRAGRRLLTARGPLQAMRERALARGDRVFERYAFVAVLLTPSWIAGIHRVRPAVYVAANTFASAIWAGTIGIGAYLVGPSIVDFANDLGLVASIGVVALIVIGVGGEFLWRRRRRRSRAAANGAADR
jgi:membrane protein DedA with SNARE-associated domain